jgi:hypothetical protein
MKTISPRRHGPCSAGVSRLPESPAVLAGARNRDHMRICHLARMPLPEHIEKGDINTSKPLSLSQALLTTETSAVESRHSHTSLRRLSASHLDRARPVAGPSVCGRSNRSRIPGYAGRLRPRSRIGIPEDRGSRVGKPARS